MKKSFGLFSLALIVLITALLCSCSPASHHQAASPDPTLPKLFLDGDIAQMYEKSDVRSVAFRYESGSTTAEGYAQVKLQGHSSLAYDKKNYTINLYQDQGYNEKMKIDLGWGEESKYCLKANWIDKTHARNIVTARLVSQMQAKNDLLSETPNHGAIDGFPIEIYLNDEFFGLYTMNIPKDAWMFGMDEDNPDHIVLCGEDWVRCVMFYDTPNLTDWAVEVGEENEQTLQKACELFDFVMNSSDEAFKENFHEHLNLDATLNYYLMADFAYLRDNIGKNMLLVTYDGKLWYPSLYDLDTSWGAYWDGSKLYNYATEPTTPFFNCLFLRLENCFAEELTERYFQLRQDIFTKEHVLNEFNNFVDSIPPETFEKEHSKWGDDIPGYGLDQIEDYLDARIPVMDEKYSDWDTWILTRNYIMTEYPWE